MTSWNTYWPFSNVSRNIQKFTGALNDQKIKLTLSLLYSTPSWKLILCWILIFWQKLITNKLCCFEAGKFLLHFHNILVSNLTQAPRTNQWATWMNLNGFPVPLSKCQDNTSNKATSASFHSLHQPQSSNLYPPDAYSNFRPCFIWHEYYLN